MSNLNPIYENYTSKIFKYGIKNTSKNRKKIKKYIVNKYHEYRDELRDNEEDDE